MSDLLTLIHGDALSSLRTMESESVQTCVTSPPYWGLRDYGHKFQIGLEKTPEEYVARLMEVFQEVKRVLRDDGTLWLNLGDSYAASGKGPTGHNGIGDQELRQGFSTCKAKDRSVTRWGGGGNPAPGMKAKDLVGIPWMVAFALRADGWYLRSDIIWSKPNPMPESVTDRPTKSHEYIFLLSKSQMYFYDHDAIKEPGAADTQARMNRAHKGYCPPGQPAHGGVAAPRPNKRNRGHARPHVGFNERWDAMPTREQCSGMRNKRSVWTVATSPFIDAHFATFPPDLIEPCVLAGSPAGGIVLDPFAGSGTTGKVAIELGRKAILIEPKAEYVEMIKRRCQTTIGLPLAG
jgi:DNA modification methylase